MKNKTMTKTKTKTLVAIALVAFAVISTVAGLIMLWQQPGQVSTAPATAPSKACSTAKDCMTNGYGQEIWTCKNSTCQAATCGDGFCNSCVFSPCAASAETQLNCPKDCVSPVNPPTTPPTPVTSDLQGTTIPFGITPRDSNGLQLHFPLKAGEGKLFNVTAPACNTTAKQLRFTLGCGQTCPTSHILVKKVNGDPARVPTMEDYKKFYALTGRGGGPYVDCVPTGDGTTCTSTGNFFWKFNGDGSGETVGVYSSYIDKLLVAPISLKTSIPNFNQADSYYLYVVNVGNFPGDTRPTDVYVRGYCY